MYKEKKIELTGDVVAFLDTLDERDYKAIVAAMKDAEKQGHSFFVKKLRDKIWEITAESDDHWIRVCWFWHSTEHVTQMVCTNGFLKKTNTTPTAEIDKAEVKRKSYIAIHPPFKEQAKKGGVRKGKPPDKRK